MISLPRPYISWAALSCWEKSPKDFKRHYFFGEQIVFMNKYIKFGKMLADALETGETPNNESLRKVIPLIPKFQYVEKRIIGNSPIYPVLAKMDGFDDKTKEKIHEVKSGKLWTQKRVDNHGQLTHYSYTVWIARKVLADIDLHWVETKEEGGRIVATGKVVTFHTTRTIEDIKLYEARLERCYLGIVVMAIELSKSIE